MKSTVGPIIALFIIVLLSISTVAAAPGLAKRDDNRGNPGFGIVSSVEDSDFDHPGTRGPPANRGKDSSKSNRGIGSPDTECRAFGFDYGIAKWQAKGNGFTPEGDAHGTYVSGKASHLEWDVGASGADGIIIKAGRDVHYKIIGTSGTVKQDRPETSHVTFCGYDEPTTPLTCQQALDAGLLSATIVKGKAVVQNDAGQPIDMNLVVYEMYSANVGDQLLYDSKSHTAPPGESMVSVNVPKDAYQADLVCGDVLKWNPEYGNRVIAFEFGNDGYWAIPKPTGDVTLSIGKFYPQDNKYVFHCDADFTAHTYHWYLGDGATDIGTSADNKFYAYDPGDYTVACIAVSDHNWGAATLEISVEMAAE